MYFPDRSATTTVEFSRSAHRDGSFLSFHADLEVHDPARSHALVAALRSADVVIQVERI
jgi:guanosine-3',5'-bis(diphosphate) 3'-pyrophosphohydrolase